MRTCSVDGCGKKHKAKGYCIAHYLRFKRYGDPTKVGMKNRRGIPMPKRFWSYVEKGKSNECWQWTGTPMNNGYGRIKVDGKMVAAHRYAYELEHGPIPSGLQVLHNCYNKLCVNPSHLRIGTHADNMRDWDHTGDRLCNAVVPDCVVADVIRRYEIGGETQGNLAKELTAAGWPVDRKTISAWVTGKRRRKSL